MVVEKDQSAWLPEPPPPRPARRDAAIDAALRRFDGIDEPASIRERPPSWARTHRPQMAVIVSALLLMIVGIPAALIGLRMATPSAPAIDPAYKVFLSRLRRAVRSNDRQAVIALIGFPLRVNMERGAKSYPDARSVERDFDRIFTPRVRRAILGQRANRLF